MTLVRLRGVFLLAIGAGMGSALWAPVEAVRRPRSGRPVRVRWAETSVDARPAASENRSDLAERLYGWNCMPCHGAEGRGDGPVAQRMGLRPRDLTRGAFKLRTSDAAEPPLDEDLYRTLSVGIPPAGMPAFPQFDAFERWALVDHVKRLARIPEGKGPPRASVLPPRPVEPDPERGRRLFRDVAGCAVCHGADGKGDGPASPSLMDPEGRPAPMPNLSRGLLSFKAGDRAEDIVRVVTLGMPGSPMPAFPGLSGPDRWDLAAFIEGLYVEIPPGERVWLTAGCQSCHTAGRGKLVGPDLAGVGLRRSPDWIRRWLADPSRMLQDPELRKEFRDYPTPMPKPDLSEQDLDVLAEFLSSLPPVTRKSR